MSITHIQDVSASPSAPPYHVVTVEATTSTSSTLILYISGFNRQSTNDSITSVVDSAGNLWVTGPVSGSQDTDGTTWQLCAIAYCLNAASITYVTVATTDDQLGSGSVNATLSEFRISQLGYGIGIIGSASTNTTGNVITSISTQSIDCSIYGSYFIAADVTLVGGGYSTTTYTSGYQSADGTVTRLWQTFSVGAIQNVIWSTPQNFFNSYGPNILAIAALNLPLGTTISCIASLTAEPLVVFINLIGTSNDYVALDGTLSYNSTLGNGLVITGAYDSVEGGIVSIQDSAGNSWLTPTPAFINTLQGTNEYSFIAWCANAQSITSAIVSMPTDGQSLGMVISEWAALSFLSTYDEEGISVHGGGPFVSNNIVVNSPEDVVIYAGPAVNPISVPSGKALTPLGPRISNGRFYYTYPGYKGDFGVAVNSYSIALTFGSFSTAFVLSGQANLQANVVIGVVVQNPDIQFGTATLSSRAWMAPFRIQYPVVTAWGI